jgi:hypothetical protein
MGECTAGCVDKLTGCTNGKAMSTAGDACVAMGDCAKCEGKDGG